MKKILIAAFAWLLIPSAYLSAQPLAGTDELGPPCLKTTKQETRNPTVR